MTSKAADPAVLGVPLSKPDGPSDSPSATRCRSTEDPSCGYFPAVYHAQGRVREGLRNAGSTESYKAYLAFRGQSKEDPLAAEVRSKVGQ